MIAMLPVARKSFDLRGFPVALLVWISMSARSLELSLGAAGYILDVMSVREIIEDLSHLTPMISQPSSSESSNSPRAKQLPLAAFWMAARCAPNVSMDTSFFPAHERSGRRKWKRSSRSSHELAARRDGNEECAIDSDLTVVLPWVLHEDRDTKNP